MQRREFITLLGGAAAAWPLAALAQQPERMRRVGILHPGSPPDPWLDGLREGLRELGYVEGKDLVFEYRWAEGRSERLPSSC
jgi:putative ABC transport system substrate-binding protein